MLRPNPSPMNMMVKGKGRGTTPKSSIININIITKLVNYWKTPLEQVELTTTWHFSRKPELVIPGYVSVFKLVKEWRNDVSAPGADVQRSSHQHRSSERQYILQV